MKFLEFWLSSNIWEWTHDISALWFISLAMMPSSSIHLKWMTGITSMLYIHTAQFLYPLTRRCCEVSAVYCNSTFPISVLEHGHLYLSLSLTLCCVFYKVCCSWICANWVVYVKVFCKVQGSFTIDVYNVEFSDSVNCRRSHMGAVLFQRI